MRIVMIQYDRIDPPVHGGAWENLATALALASLGHTVEVLLPTTALEPEDPFLQSVSSGWHRVTSGAPCGGARQLRKAVHPRVSLELLAGAPEQLVQGVAEILARSGADWVLSSEAGHGLGRIIDPVLAAAPIRWCYLPKTVHCQPFGPLSVRPDPVHAELLRSAELAIAPSRFARDYLVSAGFSRATHCYFPADTSPQAPVASGAAVLYLNPSEWKGWRFFDRIAAAFPGTPFQFVRGWGTSDDIAEQLLRRPNVSERAATGDRDRLFSGIRLLLVPSLCYETYGQVVPQALLRGVPVLSSAHGGLAEAGLDAATLLEVEPWWQVEGAPEPDEVSLRPWLEGVERLLSDDCYHAEVAALGRERAQSFLAQRDWQEFAGLLQGGRHD